MYNKNGFMLALLMLSLLLLLLLQLFAQTVQCAPTTFEEPQQQLQKPATKSDNLQQRHRRQIWSRGFDDFGGSFGGFGDNPFFSRPGNNNNNNFAPNTFARPPRQRQRQRPGEPLIFSGGNTPAPANNIPTDTNTNDDNTINNNNNNNNVVYVNNQPVVATMAPFTARTTSSPQFLNCFGSCLTTSEYNPICASNQQQYQNEQKFDCARSCGADIQIVRRGSCEGLFAMQRG